MQSTMRVGVVAALLSQSTALRVREAQSFGPNGCVSVDRSAKGSCVLHSRCDGTDVSNFDFSFDCVSHAAKNALPAHSTHSLGVGSFDDTEDFDTGVQCSQCLPPPGAVLKAAHKDAAPAVSAAAVAKNGTSSTSPAAVARAPVAPEGAEQYGPNLCVYTWRNETSGTCVMKTDCGTNPNTIAAYDFGFQCSNENGEISKHMYGQNSFASQETFDTQVSCDRCIALDSGTAKDISNLAQEVTSLQGAMADLGKKVQKIIAKVGDVSVEETTDGDADEDDAAEEKAQAKKAARKGKKHQQKQEKQEDEDEDDEQDSDSSQEKDEKDGKENEKDGKDDEKEKDEKDGKDDEKEKDEKDGKENEKDGKDDEKERDEKDGKDEKDSHNDDSDQAQTTTTTTKPALVQKQRKMNSKGWEPSDAMKQQLLANFNKAMGIHIPS